MQWRAMEMSHILLLLQKKGNLYFPHIDQVQCYQWKLRSSSLFFFPLFLNRADDYSGFWYGFCDLE